MKGLNPMQGGEVLGVKTLKDDKRSEEERINCGRRIEWDSIRKEYIENATTSQKSLAEKYDIRVNTLREHAREHGWYDAKKEYQAGAVDRLMKSPEMEKSMQRQADALAGELKAVNQASKVIQSALDDQLQFNRHIVNEGSGGSWESTEKIFKKIDAKALKDVVQSLQVIEELKRSLMMIRHMDDMDRARIAWRKLEIEEERLKLEQRRYEQSESDKDITVIIKGYEEGWDG